MIDRTQLTEAQLRTVRAALDLYLAHFDDPKAFGFTEAEAEAEADRAEELRAMLR